MDRLLDYFTKEPLLAADCADDPRRPAARFASASRGLVIAPNEAIRLRTRAPCLDLRSANQFRTSTSTGAKNLPGDQIAADPGAREAGRQDRRSLLRGRCDHRGRAARSRRRARRTFSLRGGLADGRRRTLPIVRVEGAAGGHRLTTGNFAASLAGEGALERRGSFTERSVEDEPGLREQLLARSGQRTLPQVCRRAYIGGARKLRCASTSGEPGTTTQKE
jgi:hypothetical protein